MIEANNKVMNLNKFLNYLEDKNNNNEILLEILSNAKILDYFGYNISPSTNETIKNNILQMINFDEKLLLTIIQLRLKI